MRPRRRKERNEESFLEVAAGAGQSWGSWSCQSPDILDSKLTHGPRRLQREGCREGVAGARTLS